MERLQLSDFYNYRFISRLTCSDDKQKLACTVTMCDAENNGYKNSIYLSTKEGFKKITGLDKESSFIFMDDDTLLFATVRDKADAKRVDDGFIQTVFYRLSLSGGEAIKAFTLPLSVTGYQRINADQLLIKASIDLAYADYYSFSEDKKKEMIKAKKEGSDYEVIDEIPWWSNGGGFTNKKRTRLFIYTISEDKLMPITEYAFNAGSTSVSEELQKILYTGDVVVTKPNFKGYLYLYDMKTNTTEVLVDGTTFRSVREPHFVGDTIFFAANIGDRHGNNENPYFYTVDAKTKEVKLLAKYEDSLGSSVGSDCRYGSGESIRIMNDKIYFITTIKNASHLYSLDLNGKIEKIIEQEGSIDLFDMSDKTIYFVGMQKNQLQEVYAYDLETKKCTQISTLNAGILDNKYVANYNKLSIDSDGRNIDGWVLLPKDYDASKQYPAILVIHGGPKTVYGEVFYHEMQFWANEGYFVMFCNPTGSDGKGNEFADIRGKYGTIDYDDIMHFVDAVLEKYPAIDAKKVGVTGGSYGGFMTNWIIGHTDRFVCAATQRSISNWLSMYGTCDIGFYFAPDQMDATPFTEEGQEKMWWHSPLKYAANVKTPTLFIHSNEDYRCWIPEGMQLFTALTDLGVPTRMCYFKGENHELSRSGKPLHRTRRLTEITDWMNHYCK